MGVDRLMLVAFVPVDVLVCPCVVVMTRTSHCTTITPARQNGEAIVFDG
jgi:hypothetical protein